MRKAALTPSLPYRSRFHHPHRDPRVCPVTRKIQRGRDFLLVSLLTLGVLKYFAKLIDRASPIGVLVPRFAQEGRLRVRPKGRLVQPHSLGQSGMRGQELRNGLGVVG